MFWIKRATEKIFNFNKHFFILVYFCFASKLAVYSFVF